MVTHTLKLDQAAIYFAAMAVGLGIEYEYRPGWVRDVLNDLVTIARTDTVDELSATRLGLIAGTTANIAFELPDAEPKPASEPAN